jgi:hypothetical protein
LEKKDGDKPTVDAAMSSMKLRDRILNANDTREEIVDVSEWGWGNVLCRNLTGLERAALSKLSTFRVNGMMTSKQTAADTVILGAYDPDTKEKLFRETDREALLLHNAAPLDKLAGVINELSGMAIESEEDSVKN